MTIHEIKPPERNSGDLYNALMDVANQYCDGKVTTVEMIGVLELVKLSFFQSSIIIEPVDGAA